MMMVYIIVDRRGGKRQSYGGKQGTHRHVGNCISFRELYYVRRLALRKMGEQCTYLYISGYPSRILDKWMSKSSNISDHDCDFRPQCQTENISHTSLLIYLAKVIFLRRTRCKGSRSEEIERVSITSQLARYVAMVTIINRRSSVKVAQTSRDHNSATSAREGDTCVWCMIV